MPEDDRKSDASISQSQLSDPYRKTRRLYVLFSGLLLAYALIGPEIVDPPKEHVNSLAGDIETEGQDSVIQVTKPALIPPLPLSQQSGQSSVKPITIRIPFLGNLGIRLLNPNVIPIVLGAIVAYFMLRTYFEWKLCPDSVQKNQIASWDHGISHFIGMASVAIPSIQWAISTRIGDLIPSWGILILSCGIVFLFGNAVGSFIYFAMQETNNNYEKRMRWLFYLCSAMGIILVALHYYDFILFDNFVWSLLAICLILGLYTSIKLVNFTSSSTPPPKN